MVAEHELLTDVRIVLLCGKSCHITGYLIARLSVLSGFANYLPQKAHTERMHIEHETSSDPRTADMTFHSALPSPPPRRRRTGPPPVKPSSPPRARARSARLLLAGLAPARRGWKACSPRSNFSCSFFKEKKKEQYACPERTCFAVQPGLLLGLSNEQAKTCLTVQPGLP